MAGLVMEYGNIALKKKELGFRDSLIHGEKFGRCVNNNSKCLRTSVNFISSVLTSEDVKQERVVFKTPLFDYQKADPKNVASIILGGGAGTRLFPLTSRRAKPAYNSASLNRHIHRTYNFGNGINFGDGFVEVLAATQRGGEAGMNWFQGTADAVRQFIWVFEDVKNKNIEHILILSGDHLYRMNYMDFVQKHIDTGADITVSCVPMNESRASDFGLMKIDETGRIIQFSEKPKDVKLEAMRVDTSVLGLSQHEALRYPYIASMGVYVFRRDVLLKLLRWRYPTSNDFGSEIIPAAVNEHNVQAYLFNDYWEDIGTINSFFNANLALTEQSPKFQFYDPTTPFFTSPRFLPPTKVEKCRIVNAIVSHGCFLNKCSVEHSIIGVRSRLDYGVELTDTLMMGADYYQTEDEIASLIAENKVPIGIGQNTKIMNCIIDMNAKIGKDVVITNKDGVEEADRPDEGFYIRSGITIIQKNATIKDGTII
ncbi:Glucose-1-phosphate adenylyltransferase protein [Dioscorea alata]|uniref:Glucose-1-phosphate adenylyltransferase protein n=1 Tax=Dioscorea alata TaxID=55571 RepID=A0ACB7UES3_DIOAL|nr:Glucose-1-phosphate adenylyltransferase protein [Dioscorea alata]